MFLWLIYGNECGSILAFETGLVRYYFWIRGTKDGKVYLPHRIVVEGSR
jgi:hypothetical protein